MGYGYWAPALAPVRAANLWALPPWTGDESTPALAQEWHLSGLSAPAPIEIPYAWLAPPMRFREDKAITYASVGTTAGSTSIATVPADEQSDFTATLDTVNDVDAPNLAHFMTVYYDQSRVRSPQLRFILNSRTQTEIWTLLGAGVGDRILITGVPVGWPIGADNLVIEGIQHSAKHEQRIVQWSTSPVIGETVGSVGPFFRVGVSSVGGTDLLPW